MKDRFGAKNRPHLADALPHADRGRFADRAAADEQHRARGHSRRWRRCWAERSRCTPTATTKRWRCRREEAVRIALRTQQIIAYETGVAQTVDPLGGSYFVERMTLDMEKGAFDYFDKLDAMGGMVKAIEKGYPQKEIAEASYQFQRATEAKEKITVGANEFVVEEPSPNILYIGEESARRRRRRSCKSLRSRRTNDDVRRTLDALKKAAAQEPQGRRERQDFSGEHHAVHHRCGEGLRDGRRNLRRAARGVRDVRGDGVRVDPFNHRGHRETRRKGLAKSWAYFPCVASRTAVGPQLTLGAEAMRRLHDGHQQRGADRADAGDLSQPGGTGCLRLSRASRDGHACAAAATGRSCS